MPATLLRDPPRTLKKNGELEKKYTQIFCNDWIMNLGKKLGSCLVCLRTSRPLLWFYFLLRKCPKLQIEIGGRGRHTLFTTFLLNVEKLELNILPTLALNLLHCVLFEFYILFKGTCESKGWGVKNKLKFKFERKYVCIKSVLEIFINNRILR